MLKKALRQPIVAVLGHVDHGKTTILDKIRGSALAKKEAGGITQHIGATEIPLDTICKICEPLLGRQKFTVPGLLFIDTPGHHSFVTLRARGGALADLAVVVIDINEGIMPQTVECFNTLRKYKTPFVVAANKIDLTRGWQMHKFMPFLKTFEKQSEYVRDALNRRLYTLIENLYKFNFSAERYDKITDFQKNVAIIPISAKSAEGIADLLLVLIGLAQRFLEERLVKEETGPAEGTVLEVKEVKGVGTTLDTIIYKGTIKTGDTVVVGSENGVIVTKVKALLKPQPLDEIRAPKHKFRSAKYATAAAGLKICAPNVEKAVAGAPLKVAKSDEIAKAIDKVVTEQKISIETSEKGIYLKADALGSLEALAYECKLADIPVRKAEVGDISNRDIVDISTLKDDAMKVILGFNVKLLPDAKEALKNTGVTVLTNNVIYKLIEDYKEWHSKMELAADKEKRMTIAYPGKIKILEGYVFRKSKPAIVGVRVLGGSIVVDRTLIRSDGKVVGKIKSLQVENKSITEARTGEEVAIAIDKATVGRQIDVNDILYVDIPENDIKKLSTSKLTPDEVQILEEFCKIKKYRGQFWSG